MSNRAWDRRRFKRDYRRGKIGPAAQRALRRAGAFGILIAPGVRVVNVTFRVMWVDEAQKMEG